MRARAIMAICWKDIKIYYMKGPILIMGVVLPFFLWLAFYMGRGFDLRGSITSLIMLTAFFTSSSITPIVIPWETRQKTLEMLLSRPITMMDILLGDIIASSLLGTILTFIPIICGLILGVIPENPFLLAVVVLLSVIGFSSMGVLFSAYPTDVPGDVVFISAAVRLPLVFLSGVLFPLSHMPRWLIPVALLSPLTYPTDLVRRQYEAGSFLPPSLDLLVTILFTLLILVATIKIHERTLMVRLQR